MENGARRANHLPVTQRQVLPSVPAAASRGIVDVTFQVRADFPGATDE